MSSKAVWVLGATGRCGRLIIPELAKRELPPAVIVGRGAAALRTLADTLNPQPRVLTVQSTDAIVAALKEQTDAVVVVNLIGPFTHTALPIIHALPARSDYVDISNELDAVRSVLQLHDDAVAAGRCLVTGAGWGVVAAESIALKLCEGRPAASRVRVDVVPHVESAPGAVGAALAGSIIETLLAGGRRYEGGQLVHFGLGADGEQLVLPDGASMWTGAVPSGDLEAVHRATGAPSAVIASHMAPRSAFARAMLPAAVMILSWRPLRDWATRRLAAVQASLPKDKGKSSFARATVEWTSGDTRQGWLRAGEGTAFTASVTAEVTCRLARSDARPGAYTPGALFGTGLATSLGAEYIVS